MTTKKDFSNKIKTEGCKSIGFIYPRDWYYGVPSGKVKEEAVREFVLNDDMSVSYHPVTNPEDYVNCQYGEVSTIAKLELEEITTEYAVVRCRTASIQKVDENGENYSNTVKNNKSGTIPLRHPYNSLNDRYLEVDFKNQTLTITKRFKKKADQVIEYINLRDKNEDISLFKYYLIINDLVLKRFRAMVFIADDFFEPVIELCKNNKQFQYILDMGKDKAVIKNESRNCLLHYGFCFDETYLHFARSKGLKNLSVYRAGGMDVNVIQQIAGVFFLLTNPGVESIYKSIYKSNLYQNIVNNNVFLTSNIAEIHGVSKTGNKAMTETYKRLTDPENLLAQSKVSDVSSISQMAIQQIEAFSDNIDKAVEVFNGYNNYISFLDMYFADYWYYQFLLDSSSEYYSRGMGYSRGYYLYGYKHGKYSLSEEEKFSRIIKAMIDTFFRDLTSLVELLQRPSTPSYVNNINHCFEYYIQGCRKQGFSNIAAMVELIGDYFDIQNNLNAKIDKYPADICLAHNIASVNNTIMGATKNYDSETFHNKVKAYMNLEYSNKEFAITVPERFTDLFVEGASLNHCVANYISKVNKGECEILFLRKKEDLTNPYFTICVENKKITQVKGMNQKDPDTSELRDFVFDWAEKMNLTPYCMYN